MAATVHRAKLRRSTGAIVSILLLCALIAWILRHLFGLYLPQTSDTTLNLVWLLSFASIAWTNLLAVLERPYTATTYQRDQLDKLRVVVLIPAYNEDEALLKACITSLVLQTRRPDFIEVVDDGSTKNYKELRLWLAPLRDKYDIPLRWTRTENGGKRHAQGIGIKNNPDADIYLTLDSDTVLDPKAIEEGLLPFADPRVQSVAGLCLPINVRENLLTRFSGLWETAWQLVDRSAQSTMRCVTVNSGILAFYRGHTIRKHLDGYLSETFFGRTVKFSDDSLMTLYALVDGHTVQQTTSIAFSAVPNKYSHYIRRYIRWMRGSFIRSWWRTKYLKLNSYIWWLHTWKWIQYALSTAVALYLLYTGMIFDYRVLPWLVSVPVLVAYLQCLRYFIIDRSDESFFQQCLTFMTAPIAMIWMLSVMRVVKLYAYATVYQNGWNTRGKVEVGISPAAKTSASHRPTAEASEGS